LRHLPKAKCRTAIATLRDHVIHKSNMDLQSAVIMLGPSKVTIAIIILATAAIGAALIVQAFDLSALFFGRGE
jgi:hypothetical protein